MGNRIVAVLAAILACPLLGACIFDGVDEAGATLLSAEDARAPQTFFIGGSVEGATGSLTLQNSNGRTLTLTRDGEFAFETQMVPSALYNVTVAVHPNSQTCRVAHGSGMVRSADIRDVTVICTSSTYLWAKR
jgi:thioredoxin reductase